MQMYKETVRNTEQTDFHKNTQEIKGHIAQVSIITAFRLIFKEFSVLSPSSHSTLLYVHQFLNLCTVDSYGMLSHTICICVLHIASYGQWAVSRQQLFLIETMQTALECFVYYVMALGMITRFVFSHSHLPHRPPCHLTHTFFSYWIICSSVVQP
jgi:hypothetical protein